MFECSPPRHSTPVRPAAVTTAELHEWLADLTFLDEDVTDAERIEQLRGLEELKAATAAAQARVTAALDESVRAERAARGVPAAERARGIGAQVALARRDSPNRGGRHLGFARALVDRDAAHPGGAHRRGALGVAGDPAGPRDRMPVPGGPRPGRCRACADPATLAGLGDRAVGDAARRAAYRLDPQAAVDRANGAPSPSGA